MTERASDGSREGAGRSASSLIHPTDLVITAVLLALCAFLYWDTTTFATVPPSLAQGVPPTLFPRLMIAAIALMALFLPFEHLAKRRQGIDLDGERRHPIRGVTYLTVAALFVVVLITPRLGTLPAMVVACAVLPLLWGERRYWLVAAYAVIFPLLVTVLFVAGLEVNFMPGIVGHIFR